MRVHNKVELKALIKESIQNGTVYDLDGRTVMTHTMDHVADILIEKSGDVVLRSYPVMGETHFETVGNVSQ